ncbi:MAG: GNAT family N-acetyltransferase [Myxococcota bacterium]
MLSRRGLDQRVLERLDPPPARSSRGLPLAPEIRPMGPSDRSAVVAIAAELVRTGDTYAYAPDTSADELWHYWHPLSNGDSFVATVADEVVGMFVIRPNHPGPGSHIANASYAVRADQRGLGVGRAMGEASLVAARELGYRAMQFNIVVSTNRAAVRLWRSLGFRIAGTIPEGFRLPSGQYVAHHILFRQLS